jgi:membrane protein implicated in regulation of membrane protease activity
MRSVAAVLVGLALLLAVAFAVGTLNESLANAIPNPSAQTVVFVVSDAILVGLAVWLWRRAARRRSRSPQSRAPSN